MTVRNTLPSWDKMRTTRTNMTHARLSGEAFGSRSD